MDDIRDHSHQWLSVAEVARLLGVSPMTIYREIAANRFPALRIGRRIRVPARALERMAETAEAIGGPVSVEDFS